MKLIFNWLVQAVAIVIAAYILPGVTVENFLAALVLAVVLGAINTFIKPVLIVLTLPLTIVTLGIFILVLNALLIMLASAIVPGFAIAGFWSAFLFAIVLSLVSAFLHSLEPKKEVA
jgi:putative membrane protein